MLVGEYLGLTDVEEWIARDFPLWRLEEPKDDGVVVHGNGGGKFLGHWRSRKADQSFGIVETDLHILKSDSGELTAFAKSEGTAETQCPEVKLLNPNRLMIRWSDSPTDHGTECVLSLDENFVTHHLH